MTVMEAARQLGVCIQEDARYTTYVEAQKTAENDKQVKQLGDNLQELQDQYNQESLKPTPDENALRDLQIQYEELYRLIYQTPAMSAMMDAKEGMDQMMNEVMNLLYLVIAGNDPKTVEVTPETLQQMQAQMMQM